MLVHTHKKEERTVLAEGVLQVVHCVLQGPLAGHPGLRMHCHKVLARAALACGDLRCAASRLPVQQAGFLTSLSIKCSDS